MVDHKLCTEQFKNMEKLKIFSETISSLCCRLLSKMKGIWHMHGYQPILPSGYIEQQWLRMLHSFSQIKFVAVPYGHTGHVDNILVM